MCVCVDYNHVQEGECRADFSVKCYFGVMYGLIVQNPSNFLNRGKSVPHEQISAFWEGLRMLLLTLEHDILDKLPVGRI